MNEAAGRGTAIRAGARWVLAGLYLIAAGFHFVSPRPFLTITPSWVPYPDAVIWLTGLAELLGAVALVQPWSRSLRLAGGLGLALYAVCVYPANVNHMLIDLAKPDQGLGLGYHIPRLIAQPAIVWLALWVAEVTEWPFGRRRVRA